MKLLLKKIKIILPLFLLVFASCKNENSQPLEENNLISFTPRLGDTLVTAQGFECGTSKLWDEMFAGLGMPKNYKDVSFIVTKKNFYSFLSIAEKNSFAFIAFDIKQFKELHVPTVKDRVWLTLPFANDCFIRTNETDSFPATISYAVHGIKQLKVSIATDSIITNQLLNIIVANKLGTLTSRI
jgi:uncharacterized protein YneR